MFNNKIIKRINKDLRIEKMEEESVECYFSRIVYSGISMWLRFTTLDSEFFDDNNEFNGVSKSHMFIRCDAFLQNILTLVPEIKKWFYPENDINNSENKPITVIRKKLYNAGELVDIGFKNRLALPKHKKCLIGQKFKSIRGYDGVLNRIMTGLVQLEKNKEKKDIDYKKIWDFYGLSNETAEEALVNHYKNAEWSKFKKIDCKVFNYNTRNKFCNSWKDVSVLKPNEYSVYLKEPNDFGFIKIQNNIVYLSQIDSYLIENYEVRRFMYALKSKFGIASEASYKICNDKFVKLKLYSKLPKLEESILFLFGWPEKNINDSVNLVFNKSVWDFVKKVILKLNIELKETNYE